MVAPDLRARSTLTARLRQARVDAGLTGGQLAARLGEGWSQPKVSKLENGRRLPDPREVDAWATATGTDPRELRALLDRARHEYSAYRSAFAQHGGADQLQEAYGAAELRAKVIASYQPLLIPGLLQTADYTRELLSLPGGPLDSGATADEVAGMVAARMRRSAILYEPGRQVTILVGEGALRTRYTTQPIMHDQLEHIARLAESEHAATVGVVPFSRPAPIMVFHGWELTDDVITVETPFGDLDIADPLEVARYGEYLDLLLGIAEIGSDAAILCRSIAAGLQTSDP
jgi:transcriptional regulator with XRE-family HTH domain